MSYYQPKSSPSRPAADWKFWPLSTPRTNARRIAGILAVAALVLASCARTIEYHPRPVSATLEIEVQGQWKAVTRMTYTYDDFLHLPLPELERILRERESRGEFGPTTTALRVLIEQRRAGMADE